MSELSVIEYSKEAIRKGSKSFSLASRFFNKKEFESAVQIYAWCRYCDDAIDEGQADLSDLHLLRMKTFQESNEPAFTGFKEIRKTYSIPDYYPSELLEGMRMDIEKHNYRTIHELSQYCYRVAGTVGLMMTHVMGLYDEKALKHAAHLGMAMQLTNICRDVKEDFERGRIYLPSDLLTIQEINTEQLLDPTNRGKIFEIQKHLLSKAEEFYHIGEEGIYYLPFKSSLAVCIALNLYREIGREILRRGPAAIESRTVISKKQKFKLIIKSLWQVTASIPFRITNLKKPVKIQQIWSHG